MEQYISKDALVAEIEKRLTLVEKRLLKNNSYSQSGEIAWERDKALYDSYKFFLSFVNTLEVKEVNLEKEISDNWESGYELGLGFSQYADIAKYFFELGLRSTITEKDCKLIWNIGDEIPNMPEEEFFKELLKRYKAQKGEEV